MTCDSGSVPATVTIYRKMHGTRMRTSRCFPFSSTSSCAVYSWLTPTDTREHSCLRSPRLWRYPHFTRARQRCYRSAWPSRRCASSRRMTLSVASIAA